MPHDHPHGPSIDPERLARYQSLATAVLELLIEKSVISSKEIDNAIEAMEGRGPALGARMVARAWSDPDYKVNLLSDGSAAAEQLNIPVDGTRLIVVENTEKVHNLVVCTLCSCYPRNILGLPPRWYKSTPYRARAVKEPRDILKEFGTIIPDTVAVRVHDSTADMRYMVLPARPFNTKNWNEERLAKLVTRDAMIGVTSALEPYE
jgi:nitrile hydratase